MIAFSIRPDLANYVYKDQKPELDGLKEILKVGMYMNRLLIEGEQLFLGQRKKSVLVKVDGKLRNEYELNLEDLDEKDVDIDLRNRDVGS